MIETVSTDAVTKLVYTHHVEFIPVSNGRGALSQRQHVLRQSVERPALIQNIAERRRDWQQDEVEYSKKESEKVVADG